jgi:MATE family multidrug resistance protein
VTDEADRPTVERAQVATSLGHECRLQGLLAMPLVATSLAELGMWYTDVELAAVSLSGLLVWETILAGVAVISMVGVIVGRAFGQGDRVASRRALQQGLWVAVTLTPPAMLVAWFLMDALAFTNQDPEVLVLGETYLHAMVWAIPPMLCYAALQHFLTGLSRPFVITGTVWLVLPINLALNYVLVFGAFGVPAMPPASSAG